MPMLFGREAIFGERCVSEEEVVEQRDKIKSWARGRVQVFDSGEQWYAPLAGFQRRLDYARSLFLSACKIAVSCEKGGT